MEFILENQDDESAVDLFMIEEIDAEKNLLVLAKKFEIFRMVVKSNNE